MNKDQLLEKYSTPIQVGSQGFVRLVDIMGDDSSVVQAARISYGKGTKTAREDEALIRYLIRNYHSTPLEMAEIKFHIKLPIDVMRQLVRHRTACLSGRTELHFDLPGGIRRRGNQLYKLTIEQLYEKFSRGKTGGREDTLPELRKRIQNMHLRCVNEETREIQHTKIVDIWESGKKTVYRVELESGAWFECSQDHMILLDSGEWKPLRKIVDLNDKNLNQNLTDLETKIVGIVSNGGTGVPPKLLPIDETTERWLPIHKWERWYEVSNQGRIRRIASGQGVRPSRKYKKLTLSNGRHVVSLNRPGRQEVKHVAILVAEAFLGPRPPGKHCCHTDGNSLNNYVENLRWDTCMGNTLDRIRDGAPTHMRSTGLQITRVENLGRVMTYDIEVEGPWHNFSAGGAIVHNSLNEVSTRYSEVSDEFNLTPEDEWRFQAKDNKQGSSGSLEEWNEKTLVLFKNQEDHITKLYSNPGQYLSLQEANSAKESFCSYKQAIDMGVAREQARKMLPLSTYTEIYWKMDLRNLLNFLRLRVDSHAQQEIREFANVIADIVKDWVPYSWEAFEDYNLGSVTLSKQEWALIKHLLKDGGFTDLFDLDPLRISDIENYQRKGLFDKFELGSTRERAEFWRKLND